MTTQQVHRYSGTFLSLYITQHLLNHLMALGSPELHIVMMGYARLFYRNWIVEPLLWVAVLTQVYSGIRLALKHRGRGDRWARWQRYSGLYLAFFLLLHTSAVLYGRFGLGMDTNFWYGAAVVQTQPHVYFFAPYYALAILAYGVHMTVLWRRLQLVAKAKNRNIQMQAIQQQTWIVLGLIVLLTIAIMWGLMRPMTLPVVYQL